VPVGTTVRYDSVPLEDFLACLRHFEDDVRQGYLPRPEHLKEAMIQASWSPRTNAAACPLALYILHEKEALSDRVETFVVLSTESAASSQLRDVCLRLRGYLESRGMGGFFRIDPRYGLLYGSALEPVDPAVKWDRPGAYAALYLTRDAGSPSLALLDYVPLGMQERYKALFLKYNRLQPPRPGFFASALKKFRQGPAGSDGGAQKPGYTLLKVLAAFLNREKVTAASLSLIFKDLSPADTQAALLDGSYATFYPSGHDRFLNSLGDLA